jgi:CheY-like chemotaxis protein
MVFRMARIVCLDDEPNLLAAMALHLRRAGHEVWATESSADALSLIRTGVIDLLVQDIMRPKMDGLTLLRVLRSDPKWADFPVIILSMGAPEGGLPPTGDPEEDRLRFADAWLNKPWTSKALIGAVAEAIAARDARRAG